MQRGKKGQKSAINQHNWSSLRSLTLLRVTLLWGALGCILLAAVVAVHAGASREKASSAPSAQLDLSAQEKAWLAEGHTARVRVVDYPPFQIVDNGTPRGISIDLLRLIEKRTGVDFEFVRENRPFADALQNLTNLKGPDLIQCMTRTPERESRIAFTESYLSSPRIICTRKDAGFVSGIRNLYGKSIAVPRGTVVSEKLQSRYPMLSLLRCDSDEEALRRVAAGKAKAYVGNLTLASYIIREHGLANLKVAAPSPLGDHVFCYGIRRDWPELASIINKALDTISPKEKAAIQNRYLSVRYEHGVAPEQLAKWVLSAGGVAALLLLALAYWNRNLGRKARERASELARSEERFRATFEQAAVGIAHVAPDGRLLRINQRFGDIVGYPLEELKEFTFQDITHPDDLDADLEHVQQLLDGKDDTYSMEKRYFRKDGKIVWVNLTVSLIREDTGEPRWFVSVIEDITRRKAAEEKIRKYQERLKGLASQITVAEERERQRIATELHDRIGQTLALARLQVTLAREATSTEELESILDDISDSMLEASQDARRLVSDLSYPSMNELGLGAAISDWIEKRQLEERYDIKTKFIDHLSQKRREALSDDARAILFRNVRELLTNVIKHAQADSVSVRLEDADSCIRAIVRDDGVGFDPEEVLRGTQKEAGFGLFSIEERMADLGGSTEIESAPGQGCTVTLTIPEEEG